MKAIIWTNYGSPEVLKVSEVATPIPNNNELLIKIHAATATPGDCELRRFDMHILFWLPVRLYMGILKPKRPILGMELSGEIVSVGNDVTAFKVGDHVFGGTGLRLGAYAEYVCMNETNAIAIKPTELSYEDAATIPTAGVNALHYLRKAKIKQGQKILIIGAAGCFGTYGVQIAKYLGAEVTAVDSTNKLNLLRTIGADHVIDYTQEDYTKNGKTYDVIFDVVGKRSVTRAMKSLTPTGRYVLATPWVRQVLQGLWGALKSKRKFIFALAQEKSEDLIFLAELLVSGKIKTVIDKKYKLEQMVEVHRYIESGQKIGNIVILTT